MKLIYRIAKAELQMLFYSPVAWFLLVIFAVQTGMFFTAQYEWFMKGNELGNGNTFMVSMRLSRKEFGELYRITSIIISRY